MVLHCCFPLLLPVSISGIGPAWWRDNPRQGDDVFVVESEQKWAQKLREIAEHDQEI